MSVAAIFTKLFWLYALIFDIRSVSTIKAKGILITANKFLLPGCAGQGASIEE